MYFAYFFKPGRQILQILVIEMIVNLLFLILKYLENNRIYRKFVCEAITFENRAKIDFYIKHLSTNAFNVHNLDCFNLLMIQARRPGDHLGRVLLNRNLDNYTVSFHSI